jgi:hypothetical protein
MNHALAGTEAPDWALAAIIDEEHNRMLAHEVFQEIAREHVLVDTRTILMPTWAMKKQAKTTANGLHRAVRVFEKGRRMYTEVPQGFERLLLLQTLYGTKAASVPVEEGISQER